MISTRRGFLSTLAGMAAVSPWRPGWSEPPPRGAHDTFPSAATASGPKLLTGADFPNGTHTLSRGKLQPTASGVTAGGNPGSEVRSARAINKAAPFSPASEEEWLDAWQRLPRVPLVRNQIPQLGKDRLAEWYHASLITCRIQDGRELGFIYQGGSEPGTWRNVLPVLLFTVPDDVNHPDLTREPVYLLAHCLKRNAVRTFRLDRIAA